MNDVKEFYARDRAAWRAWLAQHHDKAQAVWLVFDKGKHATLRWEDIVQEALCFGWIDSKGGKVDDTRTKLYVARRKSKSGWSKINKAHVESMIAAGLMTPAGQKVIDEAKASGAWDLLSRSDNLEIPAELSAAFAQYPGSKANFDAFTNSAQRILLEWFYAAKREETRRKRAREIASEAAHNRKANEWRAKQ